MEFKKIIKYLLPYGLIVLLRRIISKIPLYLKFKIIDNDIKDNHISCISILKNYGTNEILKITREDIMHPLYLRNNTSDVYVYKNVFEEYIHNFTVKNEPKYIIDAGANIGMVTLFFANKYKNAKIISVEPENNNYELLVENTKNYSNITTIKSALWNDCREIYLYDCDSNWGFQVGIDKTDNNDVKQLIKTISISKIMDDFNIDSIDILKIDIEGSEKEVFESNNDFIKKTNCIIIELHERLKKGCNKAFFKNVKMFDDIGIRKDNIYLSKNNYIKML